jgi:membrane-bound ClpP family serine protease
MIARRYDQVFEMLVFGFVLLMVGILLVLAETHAPGGLLGALGGLALIIGGVTAITSVGGAVALAVPVGAGLGVLAGGWTLMVTREAALGPLRRIRTGAESMHGRVGVVRRWENMAGQVSLDGALWRARWECPDDDARDVRAGDRVVVESMSGLTLCVRAAEAWELNL